MRFTPGCCCGGEGACGTIDLTVRECPGGGFSSGASVTVYDADEDVVGSGTTNGSGFASIPIPAAGTYTIVVSKAPHPDVVLAYEATCSTNVVAFRLGAVYKITVSGCGCALPGATVLIEQTAGGIFCSGPRITPSSGLVDIWVPFGPLNTFDLTITAPLYLTYTESLAGAASTVCSIPRGITLHSDPDYFCYGGEPPECRDPIPATVNLTITSGPHAGTHALPFLSFGTGGYVWSICLPGGSGAVSTRYSYAATGGGFVGSPGGCNVPGGSVGFTRYGGAACTGTTIDSFSYLKVSGTAACPVACVCGTAPNDWIVSE